MKLKLEDLDILLFDFATECYFSFRNYPKHYEEDKKAILKIAHKMISPNFSSTNPGMTIQRKIREELGLNIPLSTCKQINDGWIRISKLMTAWND